MNRVALAIAAGLLLLAGTPSAVAANTPVDGHDDRYPHPTGAPPITLGFHFSGVPAWAANAVRSAWEDGWSDTAGNTSRIPRLVNSGGGTVYYEDQGGSPCTGDTSWIGCNPNTPNDRTGWSVHLRQLPSNSAPAWLWFQRDGTCADVRNDGWTSTTCFSITRVATHEMEHNTLTRSHDSQGEADTVMGAVTPTRNGAPSTWNVDTFLRCDNAGALLEYGAFDPSLRYPNCFATVPGEGAKGLNTTLTVGATSYAACANGSTVTVVGRLALENDWKSYRYLANTPLEGRVISIYRKPSGATDFPASAFATATASDAAGSNWSKAFSSTTAAAYDFKAVWATSSGEPALNSSNAVTWTIRWTTAGCPLAAPKTAR